MQIVTDTEALIEMLQILNSSAEGHNLAVVISGEDCSVKIADKLEITTEITKEASLTGPNGVKRERAATEEGDLLDYYIMVIEMCLTGEYNDSEYVSRPSADTIQVSVPISCMTEADCWPDPEEARAIFSQEIPNLVKLYENVGWQVTCDDDLEYGTMVFTGKVAPSPYRKILEGIRSEPSEEVVLTTPGRFA